MNYFLCKPKFDKMLETGIRKTVTEQYLVGAFSFTEAEAHIIEEITPFISGDFTVSAVNRINISEIFWDKTGDKWYKVKTNFITIDEKTGCEKKTAVPYLVQASEFKTALNNFMEGMKGTLADFEIISIAETPIMDVFLRAIDKSQSLKIEGAGLSGTSQDTLFEEAKALVIEKNYCSTSLLQRAFSIGYKRVSKLIGELENAGIIEPFNGISSIVTHK